MPTAKQFVDAFTKATSLSSGHPFFESMKNALKGNFIFGNGAESDFASKLSLHRHFHQSSFVRLKL